jgi:hypothetical protein
MNPGLFIITLISALVLGACGKTETNDTPPAGNGGAPATQAATPTGGSHGSHGGPIVELGITQAGPYTVRITRDAGDVVPGGEVPLDVWVQAGPKNIAEMRFWIGTEDAIGSMKVLAPLEGENFHTHALCPDPMPAGSRVWIEVEDDRSTLHVGSIELK